MSVGAMDMARALVSLKEEIEAIDWYSQRLNMTTDAALKAVLTHHKRDEVEHAFMLIEWLRRRDADFDEFARKFLFTNAPIDAVEAAEETPRDGFAADLGLGNLKG